MEETHDLVFYVNGKKVLATPHSVYKNRAGVYLVALGWALLANSTNTVIERNADPETTLLEYLRTKLRLRGTKLGCAEGGCGACTVMVSKHDKAQDKTIHFSVNACLAPVCSMHGMAVTTVEGIGSTKTRLHPVQERIAKSHGSQCGFCTPGIVMSMYALLRNTPQPAMKDLENAFAGNLCRCTGYRPILDGFKTFTKDFVCGKGENCCRNGTTPSETDVDDDDLFEQNEFIPFDQSQEPIFPPELQLSRKFDSEMLVFKGQRVKWIRPVTLEQILELKSKYPNAKIVTGNTEIGVEMKFKNMLYPVILSPNSIPELNVVEVTETGVVFGASVTLTKINQVLTDLIEKESEHETRIFAAIVEMLKWFAGHQIRNVAAVGGNIITASPISDLNPLFMSAGCSLTLASKGGSRSVPFNQNFFTGYRKTALKADEILVSIHIPYTTENEYFMGYKQAQRREDDIAIVNAGMFVSFQRETCIVKDVALSYGGMAPTTIMALNTAKKMKGRPWNDDLVSSVCQWLEEDIPLNPGAPGGQIQYRRTLTTSFFFKFYLIVQKRLQVKQTNGFCSIKIPPSFETATSDFQRHGIKASQVFELPCENQPEHDAVGRPLMHLSAAKQATGEAVYCDDMPHIEGELYLALVTSKKAHAKILNIDATEALAIKGVKTFMSHKDVPGENRTGPVIQDEEIFASKKVECVGQVLGAIVAETKEIAQRAAKLVKVNYEELPAIITIEDAIKADSYMKPEYKRVLSNGNVEEGFNKADHVLEGEMHMGGQSHFYLETQTTLAVPKGEDGEMEIFSSTQNPTKGQMLVANALGVPANRINIRVKRMGGGFGGKETRFILNMLPVAIAANKFNCPVRSMLDRDEDMSVIGGRHPFLGKYKVGFTNEGKITALVIDMYLNAGHSMDLSHAVMEKALFTMDVCYKIPNIKATGYLCKTNLASNTAFRGFGGPQGMLFTENWLTDIAVELGISQQKVREINLYKEGDLTHFNQKIEHCTAQRCWNEMLVKSDYITRKNQVDLFNSQNRWKKRGIGLSQVKFGMGYPEVLFLNQAGAFVNIYTDGSVLLTHGGCEMGQGLHTKMIQVASRALDIPVSKIHISETSTSTVPNTTPTAASVSSDLNGMAVLNACQKLLNRLKPYIDAEPKGKWEDWVRAAYFNRVSLSATGFYATPNLGYDWDKNDGNAFAYFTFGAACSEVEIDCLTGDHVVLRTDIVMDVGKSLNPAIDVGQIEGGFIQGYGLFMLEQLKYSPSGVLYTRGPGAYKIPGFGNIPSEINVALLKDCPNEKAVYSSKGIGEPPLFLASSVFFAVKDAISSARADVGIHGVFRLDSPATSERIRLSCKDHFTEQFPPPDEGTYTPWSVNV